MMKLCPGFDACAGLHSVRAISLHRLMAEYRLFLRLFKAGHKRNHWPSPQLAKMEETKLVKEAVNTDQKIFQLKKETCPLKF
jgi:hypothetical protein